MEDPHYPLPAEQVGAFRRDGFVLTPDILSVEEIDHYGALVDEEVLSRTVDDARQLADKSTYEQSFVQCMRMWETNASIRPLTLMPKLASIASQLLDEECMRIWQDQALYKEPGGRETTPHQDLTFWPIGEAPVVTAWIPFHDITREQGAMAYVPGSHKAGRLRVVDITHVSEPYEILKDPALNGAEPQWVEVAAGGIVWHHGLTVHQAAVNRTTRPRRVFTIVYIADGYRRVKSWPTFPLERAGVEVGELIAGPGLPVAWPPAAQLPRPPDLIGTPTGPQA